MRNRQIKHSGTSKFIFKENGNRILQKNNANETKTNAFLPCEKIKDVVELQTILATVKTNFMPKKTSDAFRIKHHQ